LALIIPAVTVEAKLKGFPTANTHCPTFMLSEFPKGIYGKSVASIFTSAISVFGSAPITLALNLRLSFKVISKVFAFSIT